MKKMSSLNCLFSANLQPCNHYMNSLNKSIVFAACLVFVTIGCKPKVTTSKGTISGKLSNASQSWVYLEQIDEKGEHVLDSVITDSDGNFSMPNLGENKTYYAIRTDPKNLVFILSDGKENISLSGDAKNMEATYEISGSGDSQLIRELKKTENHLTDSLFKVY